MSSSIKHHNITVNGCTFHVAESKPHPNFSRPKNRKTVFCLHGFPEGWLGWRLLMRAMPDVRFIAPDLLAQELYRLPGLRGLTIASSEKVFTAA